MLDDLISRLERRLPEGVRRQYLAKFAVSVAVVAVVTLLASAFLFSAVQADIKGNTQESLQIAAEDDAEDIASWIDEYEQQAHVMSMYQEMQVNDGDAITSTLEVERNQMSEETHSLHYFDAETGEIIEANEAAAQLRGQPREEILGLHQSELHPSGESERYRRLFEKHVEEGGVIPDSSSSSSAAAWGSSSSSRADMGPNTERRLL